MNSNWLNERLNKHTAWIADKRLEIQMAFISNEQTKVIVSIANEHVLCYTYTWILTTRDAFASYEVKMNAFKVDWVLWIRVN